MTTEGQTLCGGTPPRPPRSIAASVRARVVRHGERAPPGDRSPGGQTICQALDETSQWPAPLRDRESIGSPTRDRSTGTGNLLAAAYSATSRVVIAVFRFSGRDGLPTSVHVGTSRNCSLSNVYVGVWSLLACLATGGPSEVRGAVVIQNSPVTADGGSSVSATDWKALLFTSGASAGVVDSITLGLNPPTGTSVPASLSVRVSLYSVVSGTPSISLATSDLVPIEMSALRQTYAMPDSVEFSLQPLTPYALVVSSDTTVKDLAGSQAAASS